MRNVLRVDHVTFLLGLASKWHTPESRRAWVRLYLRDMGMKTDDKAVDAVLAMFDGRHNT